MNLSASTCKRLAAQHAYDQLTIEQLRQFLEWAERHQKDAVREIEAALRHKILTIAGADGDY